MALTSFVVKERTWETENNTDPIIKGSVLTELVFQFGGVNVGRLVHTLAYWFGNIESVCVPRGWTPVHVMYVFVGLHIRFYLEYVTNKIGRAGLILFFFPLD